MNSLNLFMNLWSNTTEKYPECPVCLDPITRPVRTYDSKSTVHCHQHCGTCLTKMTNGGNNFRCSLCREPCTILALIHTQPVITPVINSIKYVIAYFRELTRDVRYTALNTPVNDITLSVLFVALVFSLMSFRLGLLFFCETLFALDIILILPVFKIIKLPEFPILSRFLGSGQSYILLCQFTVALVLIMTSSTSELWVVLAISCIINLFIQTTSFFFEDVETLDVKEVEDMIAIIVILGMMILMFELIDYGFPTDCC